jgi:DNA-binding transcriptional MerR regulator
MKKIIISEEKFNKVLRIIKEQGESNVFEISSDDFYKIAKLASFNLTGLSKLKKFQGRPLKIVGNLDLSDTEVTSLGNIEEVTGNLNLSNTKTQNLGKLKKVGETLDITGSDVASVEGVSYKNIRKWGSKLEKLEIARKEREERLDADQRREENLWDINNEDISETGLKANALFDYLVYQNNLEEISDEQKENLRSLKQQLEELNEKYENAEDAQEINSLMDTITDIELEIEEIIENASDVYDIIPTRYSHYGLTTFKVLGMGRDIEYAVGTEEETEVAALENAKSFIDDVGLGGFRPGYIDDYIDATEVADYFEDDFRDRIHDSPESYFDDDELGLTEEQEERIEFLEEKISEYEEQLKQHEGSDDEYYEIQDIIDELQEELDSIEPSGEPTDEMVEDKVQEMLRDVIRDPVHYLDEYGIDKKNFIDTDELAQGIVDDDGYGVLSSYDGSYDTEDVNGVTYYIFRIN